MPDIHVRNITHMFYHWLFYLIGIAYFFYRFKKTIYIWQLMLKIVYSISIMYHQKQTGIIGKDYKNQTLLCLKSHARFLELFMHIIFVLVLSGGIAQCCGADKHPARGGNRGRHMQQNTIIKPVLKRLYLSFWGVYSHLKAEHN